jgi:hypothetical protein
MTIGTQSMWIFQLFVVPTQCKHGMSFLICASSVERGKVHVECRVAQRAFILTVKFQMNFTYSFPYLPEEQHTASKQNVIYRTVQGCW